MDFEYEMQQRNSSHYKPMKYVHLYHLIYSSLG